MIRCSGGHALSHSVQQVGLASDEHIAPGGHVQLDDGNTEATRESPIIGQTPGSQVPFHRKDIGSLTVDGARTPCTRNSSPHSSIVHDTAAHTPAMVFSDAALSQFGVV